MQEHSPLPWRPFGNHQIESRGVLILETVKPEIYPYSPEQQQADVELACRAVNSHAQLISLMERAKFYLMADAHKSPEARELVRLMDAALAAATQPTGKVE